MVPGLHIPIVIWAPHPLGPKAGPRLLFTVEREREREIYWFLVGNKRSKIPI